MKKRKDAALAEMNLQEIEKAKKDLRAKEGSPGPGAYDNEIEPPVKEKESGSVFKSRSVRELILKSKKGLPGPAYYF